MGNPDDRSIGTIIAFIVWLSFILIGYFVYDNLLGGIILGGIVFIVILCSTSNDWWNSLEFSEVLIKISFNSIRY